MSYKGTPWYDMALDAGCRGEEAEQMAQMIEAHFREQWEREQWEEEQAAQEMHDAEMRAAQDETTEEE